MIIFDSNNLLHRILKLPEFFGLTFNGTPTGGAFGVVQSIKNTFQATGYMGRAIMVWDGKKSERRLKLYPEYKGNRKPKDDIAKQDADAYFSVFNLNKKILMDNFLPSLGLASVVFPHKEADDVIYQISRLYYTGEEILVISEDSDLLQLISFFPNIKVYRPIKKSLITKDNFETDVGVDYRVFILYKAILGDTGDNIGHVEGVGGKSVEKIVKRIDPEKPDESIIALAKAKENKKEARLFDNWSIVTRNKELMDLSREEFLNSELNQLKNAIDSYSYIPNFNQFELYCKTYGFNSILDKFDYFTKAFEQEPNFKWVEDCLGNEK